MTTKPTGESKVEKAKRASHQLRGTVAETLAGPATHFGGDDATLLKFHGTYQQDDRDHRKGRGDDEEKAWSFMIRIALPAGELTADQYLALDDLATTHADGSLRVTTRQGFQFHGVLKGDLKSAIATMNASLVTTLAACGDVQRNVMGCPAPLADPAHRAVRRTARALAEALRPATRAYHEIWLDGERVDTPEVEEPFYGTQYLPRKFKSAVGLPEDNCVDIYAQDVGLLAVLDGTTVRGFNVLVGGGLGMTYGKGDTIARLAEPLGFVREGDGVEAVRIVGAIFRDHGNRADRRHARLKYLLQEWGIGRFREEFRRRAPFPLEAAAVVPAPVFHDHLGAHRMDDGRWFYGIFIQSGRIRDTTGAPLRTLLREVVESLRPGVVLTGQQNLLLTGLDDAGVAELERRLKAHGVARAEELSASRRFSMACPALPTCGLAVAESERLLPSVVGEVEAELAGLGVGQIPITIRMTGCPNGCARPYTADIAFVGRSLGLYQIYVGGGLQGDRVADLYQADVRTEDLLPTLRPLLARWAAERVGEEPLGDFYQRITGSRSPRQMITGRELPVLVPTS